MKLDHLLKNIDVRSTEGDLEVEVTGIRYDSRAVDRGAVFVAIRGQHSDGNDFVDEAVSRGAVGVVSENTGSGSVPWVQVESGRAALAALAAEYYQRPTGQLSLVGITGTNGKTTTAHLVESVLQSAGHPVAFFGTTQHRGPGFEKKTGLTTPEASDLEHMFRKAFDAGCRHGVMEVSSHAIQMRRVEQLAFDVVVFTNLSPEHLDFHGGIQEYFEVKKRLFTGLLGVPPPLAVVNRDDACFEELQHAGNAKVLSFGLTPDADVYPEEFDFGPNGLEAEFETPAGTIRLVSALTGRLNLYNVAAAVAVSLALDLPTESIVDGVRQLRSVPGRFEFVDRGQSFRLIVDYAHTDDALANVLAAARKITKGKLIVVFGAGGDRDPLKRPKMGEVVARQSDFAVLTSDNPRSEDPLRIIQMIEKGLTAAGGRYRCVPDRREAIRTAIECAGRQDTVVIAGKGHETHQIIGDRRVPFDDRVVAGELLDEWIRLLNSKGSTKGFGRSPEG